MTWITPTADRAMSLPRAQIHFKWATMAFHASHRGGSALLFR
jgi:hypothetical protein